MTEPTQPVDWTPAAGATKVCPECQGTATDWARSPEVDGYCICNLTGLVTFFDDSTGVRVACLPYSHALVSYGEPRPASCSEAQCTQGWVANRDGWEELCSVIELDRYSRDGTVWAGSVTLDDVVGLVKPEQLCRTYKAAFCAAVEKAIVASGGTLGEVADA